jgi:hypothetical protein
MADKDYGFGDPLEIEQLIPLMVILPIAVYTLYAWNMNRAVKDDEVAESGEYSSAGNYKHITPLKHDLFKQATNDLISALVVSYVSGKIDYLPTVGFIEAFLSKVVIDASGYYAYYLFIEPYLVNHPYN